MTLSVWPNSYLTGVCKVRSLAKACIHCRGKQSSSAGWTGPLSWWESPVRLILPARSLSFLSFTCPSHYCRGTFAGQTSGNFCIQTVAEKTIGGRGGETGRIGRDASTHTGSHIVLLFFHVFISTFSFSPTSRSQTAAWISSWFHPVQKQTNWYACVTTISIWLF